MPDAIRFSQAMPFSAVWIRSVSYTHLDVYKRQLEARSRAVVDAVATAAAGLDLTPAQVALLWVCLLYTSRCV